MAKPKYGAISTENYVRNSPVVGATFNSGVTGNTTATGYPTTNITDPNREKKWRVAVWPNPGILTGDHGGDRSQARITIDAERPVDPGMVALIGSNITRGKVTLYGSSDSAMTEDLIAYDLDVYAAPNSDVVCMYPNRRRIRVPDLYSEIQERYSYASASAISTGTYDMAGTNCHSYRHAYQYGKGYHTWEGTDQLADDIEFLPGTGMWSLLSSSADYGDTFTDAKQANSFLYWPGADGGLYHWHKASRPKTWPGSPRAEYTPGRSIGMMMPHQTGSYSYEQWPADPSYWVTESTEAQHGFTTNQRSDGVNASTYCGTNSVYSMMNSINRTILQQTFRLNDVTSSGSWAMLGWVTTTSSDAGLWYHRDANPDLSYLNLRITPTTEGGVNLNHIIPESIMLDGKFHTVAVSYNGTTPGNSLYRIYFDGEDILGASVVTADDASNPMLPYNVGYGKSPSSVNLDSDHVDFAGCVAAPGTYGWDDTIAHQDTATINLDKQARLRHGIGGITDEDYKREFWTLDLDGVYDYGNTEDHIEIGNLWIGNRIDIETGSNSNVTDTLRSTTSAGYGGSIAVTTKNSARTAAVTVGNLSLADAQELDLAVNNARDYVIVDGMAGSEGADVRDAGTVYGTIPEPANKNLGHGSTSTFRFGVKESL